MPACRRPVTAARTRKASRAELPDADRNRLILENLKVARQEAARVHRSCYSYVEFDELHSEAMAVMVRAGRRYDPALGVSFGQFIRTPIANGLIDFLRRWTRRGRPRPQSRPPRPRTLPMSQVSGEGLSETTDGHRDDLASTAVGTPGVGLADVSTRLPEEAAADRDLVAHLTRELSWRERILLTLRYREHYRYAEIAEVLSVTPIRCRQIFFQLRVKLRLTYLNEDEEVA